MGIELISGPTSETNACIFNLPAEFDRKKLAAKWVKAGNAVQAATQREHLIGTRLTADGWEVWKAGPKGMPHKAATTKEEFVLMCRPRTIQDAVNAIYGNVGKERMMAEKAGETSGGVPMGDSGMLNESILSKYSGERSDDDDSVKLNQVPDLSGEVEIS